MRYAASETVSAAIRIDKSSESLQEGGANCPNLKDFKGEQR
jgi:hypothetical protein